jgi:hypothetical protein
MKGADKVVCQAAAVFLLFAMSSMPARAQYGFGGYDLGGYGGGDMMAQIGPMMGMMQSRMGKRHMGRMMRSMGPMMSQMMQGGGYGGYGGGDIMGMIGPMMASYGGGYGGHRHHRRY